MLLLLDEKGKKDTVCKFGGGGGIKSSLWYVLDFICPSGSRGEMLI